MLALLALRSLLQDVDSARAAEPDHVCHAQPRSFDLTLARLAPKVGAHLVDVRDSRGTQRMPLGEQAPPDALTGIRPPSATSPESISFPASPSLQRPRFS